MSIAIIDYGMGNLRSVQKAFEFLGFEAQIVTTRDEIRRADQLVLPGVGAFSQAIHTIREKEFDKEIGEAVESGKPFLGICLGMQLLFETSHENGVHEGLGILKGHIQKFNTHLKVPHVGWNSLQFIGEDELFQGLANDCYVYFVHSYHLCTDASIVSSKTPYGYEIQVAVKKGNVHGVQFHPEKSGKIGLTILKNFGGLKNANLSCD